MAKTNLLMALFMRNFLLFLAFPNHQPLHTLCFLIFAAYGERRTEREGEREKEGVFQLGKEGGRRRARGARGRGGPFNPVYSPIFPNPVQREHWNPIVLIRMLLKHIHILSLHHKGAKVVDFTADLSIDPVLDERAPKTLISPNSNKASYKSAKLNKNENARCFGPDI